MVTPLGEQGPCCCFSNDTRIPALSLMVLRKRARHQPLRCLAETFLASYGLLNVSSHRLGSSSEAPSRRIEIMAQLRRPRNFSLLLISVFNIACGFYSPSTHKAACSGKIEGKLILVSASEKDDGQWKMAAKDY